MGCRGGHGLCGIPTNPDPARPGSAVALEHPSEGWVRGAQIPALLFPPVFSQGPPSCRWLGGGLWATWPPRALVHTASCDVPPCISTTPRERRGKGRLIALVGVGIFQTRLQSHAEQTCHGTSKSSDVVLQPSETLENPAQRLFKSSTFT